MSSRVFSLRASRSSMAIVASRGVSGLVSAEEKQRPCQGLGGLRPTRAADMAKLKRDKGLRRATARRPRSPLAEPNVAGKQHRGRLSRASMLTRCNMLLSGHAAAAGDLHSPVSDPSVNELATSMFGMDTRAQDASDRLANCPPIIRQTECIPFTPIHRSPYGRNHRNFPPDPHGRPDADRRGAVAAWRRPGPGRRAAAGIDRAATRGRLRAGDLLLPLAQPGTTRPVGHGLRLPHAGRAAAGDVVAGHVRAVCRSLPASGPVAELPPPHGRVLRRADRAVAAGDPGLPRLVLLPGLRQPRPRRHGRAPGLRAAVRSSPSISSSASSRPCGT